MELEFSRQIYFRKSPQISNFIKIRWVEADPCRRTDMTKLTVAFRNFPNSSNNLIQSFSLVAYNIKTNNLVDKRIFLVDPRGCTDHALKPSSNSWLHNILCLLLAFPSKCYVMRTLKSCSSTGFSMYNFVQPGTVCRVKRLAAMLDSMSVIGIRKLQDTAKLW